MRRFVLAVEFIGHVGKAQPPKPLRSRPACPVPAHGSSKILVELVDRDPDALEGAPAQGRIAHGSGGKAEIAARDPAVLEVEGLSQVLDALTDLEVFIRFLVPARGGVQVLNQGVSGAAASDLLFSEAVE